MASMTDTITEVVEEKLSEYGLSAMAYAIDRNSRNNATKISIIDTMTGDYYTKEVSDMEMSRSDDIVEIAVEDLTRSISNRYESKITYKDKAFSFDAKDGSASCLACGETVELSSSPTTISSTRRSFAEQKQPYANFSDKEKMCLIALLRKKCDSLCPNAPDHRKI